MNFQTKYLRSFFFPLFVCFVFAISACGGGGSSGGGGQSVAGTYSGTGSGTVTVGGNSQAFHGWIHHRYRI